MLVLAYMCVWFLNFVSISSKLIFACCCVFLFCFFMFPVFLHCLLALHGAFSFSVECNLLEMETFVLKCCGYSLSVHKIISPLNFYNIFFEIVEPFAEDCKYDITALKNFGLYLIHIIMMYPTSLYKYGPNLLAASALHLTLRVCEFPFNWCDYLSEVTHYS